MVYSNMTCLFQLNTRCWECSDSIRAALNRVFGVTSVSVDATYDTVKVTGMVDPNSLLSIILSYDTHARLLWAKTAPIHSYPYSCSEYYCSQPPGTLPYVPRASGYYQRGYCNHQHANGCNIM